MDLTWWQIVLGVLVGLILLMILVIVHEIGHAWAARRNGVEVEEFGIGFPPRAKILGKYKGTLITLNWLLPLGGFCKMKGESDDAKGKGTYGAASFWAKTKILFAGVFMNLIAAMVIFSILAVTGMPKIFPGQFAIASDNHGQSGVVEVWKVVEGSPAEKAGLQKGDELLSIMNRNNRVSHTIEMSAQVSELTKKNAGQIVVIDYNRDGQARQTQATLNETGGSQGYLGVQTEQKEFANIKATWSAPLVGIVNTFQFIWMTLVGLAGLLGNLVMGLVGLVIHNPDAGAQLGAAGDSVAGPVGILGVIFPQALMAGPTQLFWLMGVISLTLTVMNLLPIPGLDGGRWFLTVL
ncbi:M50 family metallopeptidase, partial [Candidatus Saccharibacteria bacterium]|nr:M50 family metallopeptidase [Candidatus Saccharibacteria bacterium]